MFACGYQWLKRLVRQYTRQADEVIAPVAAVPLGLVLGHDLRGAPVVVTDGALCRHAAVVGAPGTGVTTLCATMLRQQTERGGGWLYLDPSADTKLCSHLQAEAVQFGRASDFVVLDFSCKGSRAQYNVMSTGTPKEIVTRLLCAGLPRKSCSQNAEFYSEAEVAALEVVVAALQAGDTVPTIGALSELLMHPARLVALGEELPPHHPAAVQLKAWLRTFEGDSQGASQFDEVRARNAVRALTARLLLLSLGPLAGVPEKPSLMLRDVITSDKMLYVMLPSGGGREMLEGVGAALTTELAQVVRQQGAGGRTALHKIPFLCIIESLPLYTPRATEAVVQLFHGARTAGVSVVVTAHSLGQLDSTTRKLVTEHTRTFCAFKQELAGADTREVCRLLQNTVSGESLATLNPGECYIRNGGGVLPMRTRMLP